MNQIEVMKGSMTRTFGRMYIMYDEESILNNLDKKVASETTKELTEFAMVATKAVRKYPDKKRKFFSGSCRSDYLGPVPVADHKETWLVDFKTKKALHTKSCCITIAKTRSLPQQSNLCMLTFPAPILLRPRRLDVSLGGVGRGMAK